MTSKTKRLVQHLAAGGAGPVAPAGMSAAEKIRIASNEWLAGHDWCDLRYRILEQRGPFCEICGRGRADGTYVVVDHIESRRNAPEKALDPNNLQILCRECNLGKGNKTADWRGRFVDREKAEALFADLRAENTRLLAELARRTPVKRPRERERRQRGLPL